jgi:sulfatase maturation enzyme AslB (radical SAM superfamily)
MTTPNLKQIVGYKDYKIYAGPDWPTYENLVNGIPAGTPEIQLEVTNFIKQMTQTYNEINIDKDTLAENNQARQEQVFYNKRYNHIVKCLVPWNTMGINANGNVFICSSPSWVPKFAGNILNEDDVFKILNSPTAQQIRQEILQGRYYYCNNKICSFFSKVDPATYSSDPAPEDLKPFEYFFSENLQVHEIPKNLIFDFDYTCNFKCPSCRTELINTNKHHVIRPINDRIVDKIKHLVIDKIKSQPIEIRWCGGEPFISDVYLELFDYIINTGKQNIKHVIQTNGSYLKSKSDLLTKLLPMVTELRISFDAATPETYQKVRVNGIWNTLIENVEWVKEYIESNGFRTKITADFVVQYNNYQEIPAFVDLCNDLGIRHINFQKMWNWGTWSQEDFDANNIFSKDHPEYAHLVEMFKQANREMPF